MSGRERASASGAAAVCPPRVLYEPIVLAALREDLGRAGDITTDAIVPALLGAEGEIVCRAPGRIAGLEVALCPFLLLDPTMAIDVRAVDGVDAEPGDTLVRLDGSARAILMGERVALNFLGHLSGVATVTRDLVRAVDGTGARVVCTRKTTPGLRALQKYAVRCGGGWNHRFGLDDAVLIKDNHLALAGGVTAAVRRARRAAGHLVKIEVEVTDLTQLEEALSLGVDAVLLDNMDLETLAAAVRLARGRAITEASGGIRPENAAALAATGVELLSVGWITHSAPALDVALDMVPQASASRAR